MPHFSSSQNTTGEQNHILMVRMDNAKIILPVLKAVNFKEVHQYVENLKTNCM